MFPYTDNYIQYPDGLEIPMIGFIDEKRLRSHNCLGPYMIKKENYRDFSQYNQLLDQNSTFISDPAKVFNEVISSSKELSKSPNVLSTATNNGSYIIKISNKSKIMTEGILEHDCFYILEGEINLYKSGVLVSTLGPGSFVGAEDYINKRKRKNEAICDRVTLLVFKKHALDKILARAPNEEKNHFMGLLLNQQLKK